MKVDIRHKIKLKSLFVLSLLLGTFLFSATLISAHFVDLFQLSAGQQSTIRCAGDRLTTEQKNKNDVLVKCLGTVAAATPAPVVTPSPMAHTPSPTPSSPSTPPTNPSGIFGAVSTDLLGNCPANVHDRFVTTGPDGKQYRTWHPQTVPVDASNPGGEKCTFAHEHGADPSTSSLYAEAVPFGYVAGLLNMDEPHAGFKCFVANQGTKNDEGRTSTIDGLLCFHMGTGGPSRFTQRFHSMVYKIATADGKRMSVQGMADTGSVGSICDSPRAGKTVLSLGCKVDSSYEIWENVLKINNKGKTILNAVSSTAAFDPISVRDPSDHAKLVPISSADAASIFKFNDSRDGYRGCRRESYFGPVHWYNSGSTTTYFTDAYGNVTAGGPLKQEISQGNTTNFIATSDGMAQFKYREEHCGAGLGLKN